MNLAGRNTGGRYQLPAYGPRSSTPFVPYGWETSDIEEQTRAVHMVENPLLHSTTETQAARLSIPNSMLPEPPLPVFTTESLNATNSRDMEGGRPLSEILPLEAEELQNSLLIPPLRPPDTTGSESLKPSPRKSSRPRPFERDEPTKECPICTEERPCLTGFPSRIAKACSNHEQEACRDCIDRIIMAELDSNIYGPIHCAECRAVLDYEEVKALASPATFVR
jgi:hypothetical protein